MKGGVMVKKKDYVVKCHFNNDGYTLQECIEKYFPLYFQESIEQKNITKTKDNHG